MQPNYLLQNKHFIYIQAPFEMNKCQEYDFSTQDQEGAKKHIKDANKKELIKCLMCSSNLTKNFLSEHIKIQH